MRHNCDVLMIRAEVHRIAKIPDHSFGIFRGQTQSEWRHLVLLSMLRSILKILRLRWACSDDVILLLRGFPKITFMTRLRSSLIVTSLRRIILVWEQ